MSHKRLENHRRTHIVMNTNNTVTPKPHDRDTKSQTKVRSRNHEAHADTHDQHLDPLTGRLNVGRAIGTNQDLQQDATGTDASI